MNIRWIRYFVALVEAGSFSAAARKIHVAQPALSRQIRDMEAELDTVLLHRSSSGVRLTEAGERFYPAAVDILQRIETACAGFGGKNMPLTGRVTVGLPTSASEVLAAELAIEAKRRYPGIRLHIIESLSGFLAEWAESGRVDVALLYDAVASPRLKVDPVLCEQLWLVGAPDRISALNRSAITLRDALALPLVLPGYPHSHRRLLARLAEEQGIDLHVVIEADSLHAMARITGSGIGFSLLSPSAVAVHLRLGTLAILPVSSPRLTRVVAVVRPRLYPESKATEVIADLCCELAKELVGTGRWAGELVPPQ